MFIELLIIGNVEAECCPINQARSCEVQRVLASVESGEVRLEAAEGYSHLPSDIGWCPSALAFKTEGHIAISGFLTLPAPVA